MTTPLRVVANVREPISMIRRLAKSSPDAGPPLVGIPIGRESEGSRKSFGLLPARPRPDGPGRIIRYTGDAHLLTVAPTGAGKGRRCLVPALLTQPNPTIVFDPKGELVAITARYRREVMGQRIVVLDPLGITGHATDALNPLELFSIRPCSSACTAEELAKLLETGHVFSTDPYWTDTATGLASGWLAHYATAKTGDARTLPALRREVYDSDMVYRLAVMMDTKQVTDELARQEFTAFLEIPSDKTRPSVESTFRTYFKSIASEEIARVLGPSTFALEDIVTGKPLTIYIVLPPWILEAQKTLLRLWVGTLLAAVLSRPAIPDLPTLFLLDESALLGNLPALQTAATLCRGYGVISWTFWQDLAQLKTLYPTQWQTMINNAAVLQTFGIANGLMAKEWSEIMGVEPEVLLEMRERELALYQRGRGFVACDALDYLCDPEFADRFDANPRYRPQTTEPKKPRTKGTDHELCR